MQPNTQKDLNQQATHATTLTLAFTLMTAHRLIRYGTSMRSNFLNMAFAQTVLKATFVIYSCNYFLNYVMNTMGELKLQLNTILHGKQPETTKSEGMNFSAVVLLSCAYSCNTNFMSFVLDIAIVAGCIALAQILDKNMESKAVQASVNGFYKASTSCIAFLKKSASPIISTKGKSLYSTCEAAVEKVGIAGENLSTSLIKLINKNVNDGTKKKWEDRFKTLKRLALIGATYSVLVHIMGTFNLISIFSSLITGFGRDSVQGLAKSAIAAVVLTLYTQQFSTQKSQEPAAPDENQQDLSKQQKQLPFNMDVVTAAILGSLINQDMITTVLFIGFSIFSAREGVKCVKDTCTTITNGVNTYLINPIKGKMFGTKTNAAQPAV